VLELLSKRIRCTSLDLNFKPSRHAFGAGENGRRTRSFAQEFAPSRAPSRAVSLVRLVPNILHDQKQIWLSPKTLLERKQWKSVLIFLVIAGGLLLVDPHDPGYFRHTQVFHEFNNIVSGRNAAEAMWIITLAVLGVGVVRQDSYMRHTVFHAIEAVVDSEIVTQILKGIDRRVRPQDVHMYRHFLDSWFRDKGPWYSGPGSFPSGHMIAAMSLATVFALRYSERRWVPCTAYGLAVVIGFSRITLLSHFPSDVFVGGVFGYAISRYVVLQQSDSQSLARTAPQQAQELPEIEALP
jgi:membrane-associated phospholipid phosphatase